MENVTLMYPDVNCTVDGGNLTNQTSPIPWLSVQKVVEGSAMGVVSLGAFLGNVLVVVSVFTNRRLRTITNLYVVSLAIADLLVSTLVMPIGIIVHVTERWWFGVIVCDIYVSLDVMLCTASILNLCCISVDRYFAITRPLEYSTKRSKRLALIMIAVTWVAATVITCPPILGWREEDRWKNTAQCVLTRDPGYVIYSSLGSFYLPLLVMTFVYLRIMIVATRRNKRIKTYRRRFTNREGFQNLQRNPLRTINNGHSSSDLHLLSTRSSSRSNSGLSRTQSERCSRTQSVNIMLQPTRSSRNELLTRTNSAHGPSHDKSTRKPRTFTRRQTTPPDDQISRTNEERFSDKASQKENKAAKTLAVVVGGFVVCWLPFFVIYTVDPFCSSCYIDNTTFMLCTWLGYFNSMINPFIYAFYNRDFRHTFYRLTLGRCSCPKEATNSRDNNFSCDR